MTHAYELKLDLIFNALSHHSRRKMLKFLVEREATVKELAASFKMTLAGVSKHLMVLEKAGLVNKSKEGRLRHCSVVPTTLKEAANVLEAYQTMWNQQLDELSKFLDKTNPHQKGHALLKTKNNIRR